MEECAVAIVGAGPVGMVLAGELALAGIHVALLERRPTQRLEGSRAGGLQSRTIEVFDQRGIADRMLAQGTTAQTQLFGGTVLDISDFPTRHPYGLGLWQNRIEAILAGWVGEIGVAIQYGCEVAGVEHDGRSGGSGVTVRLADGRTMGAQYVVGCDGGRSLVRKAAGIAFEGWDATVSTIVAEVEYTDEPEWGMKRGERGTHGIGPIEPGRPTIRVVVTESELRQGGDPTLDDLRVAMREVWGTDFGVHSPTWISRFTDAARQATAYRAGRILLAGDAAHVHYPAGGQGLNVGVQDAMNLGWKLAQVVSGVSPGSLLDSYERERHPVGAAVLQDSLAQVALRRTDARSKAVAASVADLLSTDAGRKRFGARLSGLGVHYPVGEAVGADHPLRGRRMPDLDLLLPDGSNVRLFALLNGARGVLLDLDGASAVEAGPWADCGRVRVVQVVRASRSSREGAAADVGPDGSPWDLPELGVVEEPTAVLVRPDGYVAWVGCGSSAGLVEALSEWFGVV
ncbi:hypothetical protein B7R54_07055 [Subtercola boreus]|uniref:FAD-binding domain-containing protein n=1 Tax=Subtercola boreus TaxID=120213 RepID=A0A3E0VGC9_9MICO|nr:FAD-dependent monooxygenase [Subtercola boreus]RFA09006.1 hypothetical protein B7R54_07055 [Subtercola boreus]TQL53995.1 2-polyprenyl-6-methoxyphenol hydroxylase-like FAD-dependent oxidoreductase [Subtercola boreus]